MRLPAPKPYATRGGLMAVTIGRGEKGAGRYIERWP